MVAGKLLGSHVKRLDKKRVDAIIEALAQKTYSHGHAIGRKEAEDLGLPVKRPNPQLEEQIWKLMHDYEEVMQMRQPIDANEILDNDKDSYDSHVVIAMIESELSNWAFRGKLKLRRVRQTPGQVNINVNLGVSIPPGIDPATIPQETINQLVQQVQNDVPRLVQEQVKKQSASGKIEGGIHGGAWVDVTAEGI
jgi:hypothetical protein